MTQYIELSEEGIDPVNYINSYFTHLSEKEISVLVGSIALLGDVEYKTLESVLNLEQIQVEEKIGRLMQSDLLDGKFTDNSFQLEKFNYPILKQKPNLVLDDRILLAYLKARFEVGFDELMKVFDLSYPSLIYILSRFVSLGLITPQKIENETYKFVVHFHYEKRKPSEITELEKQIVGYGILEGKTTIENISFKLEEPEHKIISTIVTLILSNLVSITYEYEPGMLGRGTLYLKIDKFQVKFEKRSIQGLSNQEKLVIGFISLRRKVHIEELEELTGSSKSEILKTVSVLVGTNQYKVELIGEDKFRVKEIKVYPINRSVETLSTIYSFNYKVLIGILKTQQRISVKEIATKMRERETDVLVGLITSYLEGLITGFLNNKYHFILQSVKRDTNRGEITLEDWERIIMGALISEEILTWPKIAALLEIDRTTARDRAFEFISRGIARTQAKDTALILNEIPSLPLLVQVNDLELEDQQLFGYIIGTEKPNVNQVKSLFDYSNIEAYRRLYYLTGSGLFILRRNKNELQISRKQEFEPIYSVGELDLETQKVVRYIQSLSKSRISIKKISKNVDLSVRDTKKHLYFLFAHGYYTGYIEGDEFFKRGQLSTVKEPSKCLYCSSKLENLEKPCPSCDKQQPICGVCKGPLTSTEQLVACPHCKNLSHSLHLKQWLNIKGECPFCRERVTENQLEIRPAIL